MSFEYNGFIHRDLEPQVRYDAEQIQLLKQADVAINNKIDALPLGGEKVALTFPAGASEGTITEEQLAKLQASESNYIEMVNDKELYYLNDNGHTEGFLTYSHVGIENSKATIKTLTITVSAKSFVIVTTVVPTESGGKLYQHTITLGNSKTDGSTPLPGALTCRVINTKNTPYTQSTITIETVANVAFSGFNDAASGQAPILYEGVFVNYQNTLGIICVQILGYGTSDYKVEPYFSSGLPIDYDPVSDTVTEL